MFGGAHLRRRWARRRAGERGLTLIETMITVVVVGVGVAGIMVAVAAIERSATTIQNQSQLQVAMRQLADFVRDSSPSTGLQYSYCEQVPSGQAVTASSPGTTGPGNGPAGTYEHQLTLKFPALPRGVSEMGFMQISESVSGSGSHDGTPTSPKSTTGCAANTGDWGVQEIKLAVFGGGNQVTRTIWKSDAWCYFPASNTAC